jgi:hypothetical protein
LRYWLCPSLKRPSLGRASKPLLRVKLVSFSGTILVILAAARVYQVAYICGYLRVTSPLLFGRFRPEPRAEEIPSGQVKTDQGSPRRAAPKTPHPKTPSAAKRKAALRTEKEWTQPVRTGQGANPMGTVPDGDGTRPVLPPSYTEPGSGASAERHRRTAHIAPVRRGAGTLAWDSQVPYAPNFRERRHG